MGLGKGAEGLPVSDFRLSSRGAIRNGLEVPSSRFALQPKIDGVATDMKHITGFGLPHAIEFDRLNHFFAEIIAVRIGHRGHQQKHSLYLDRYCPS